MKKTILFFVFCLSISIAFGQKATTTPNRAVDKTAELTEILSLNEEQEAKVLKIQQRKDEQFASIQYLLKEDTDKYLAKLKSIHDGNEISIQRLLNKTQLRAYHMNRNELRMKKHELAKTMRGEKRNEASIEVALIRLEYDFDN